MSHCNKIQFRYAADVVSSENMQPSSLQDSSVSLKAFICLLMMSRIRSFPQISKSAVGRLPFPRVAASLPTLHHTTAYNLGPYALAASNAYISRPPTYHIKREPMTHKINYANNNQSLASLQYRWRQPVNFLPPLPLKTSITQRYAVVPHQEQVAAALQTRFNTWQRPTTPEIAQQRYQGNYYRQPLLTSPAASDYQAKQRFESQPQIASPDILLQGSDVTLGRRGSMALLGSDLSNAATAGDNIDHGHAALVHFENRVLHVTPKRSISTPATITTTAQATKHKYHSNDYRQRRQSSALEQQAQPNSTKEEQKSSSESKAIQNPTTTTTTTTATTIIENESSTTRERPLYAESSENATELKFFQDIFMRYNGPQSVAYGHVERKPQHYEQRFESAHKGNRYKGEILWADEKTGGFGAQHWDLAQGRL